jgi:hypothetical protein
LACLLLSRAWTLTWNGRICGRISIAIWLRRSEARLNQRITPRYFARLSVSITYEVVEIGETHIVRPDVSIHRLSPSSEAGTSVAIPPAPVKSRIPLEVPLRLYSVEIRKTDTGQLVTVIEILSPVNKRVGHEAHADYLRKRRDLLRSSVHLMEIDLLRGGERPPLEDPVPPAPYYVLLSRADRRPTVEVWPIRLMDPLPVLPVPLLEPDPDVPLDLGAAVATVYERGAYGVQIDYRQPPPPPPLSEEEMAWLDARLRELGYR